MVYAYKLYYTLQYYRKPIDRLGCIISIRDRKSLAAAVVAVKW